MIGWIQKNIYIGLAFLILIGLFYWYYSASQKEIKQLYSDKSALEIQKQDLIKDINEQAELVKEMVEESNSKTKQIQKLEIEKTEIRQDITKLKLKLEKHNFDKIVKSSDSRKKKVEKILKDSTFKELTELEEITQKISKKINKEEEEVNK